jgi:hypothetical protein
MAKYKSVFGIVGILGDFVFQKNGVVRRVPKNKKIVSEKVKMRNYSFGKASRLSAKIWCVLKNIVKKKQNSHSLLTSALQKCFVEGHQWNGDLLKQTLEGYSFVDNMPRLGKNEGKVSELFYMNFKDFRYEVIVIEVFIGWDEGVVELQRIEKTVEKNDMKVLLDELESEKMSMDKGIGLRYLIIKNEELLGAWVMDVL